MSSGFITENEAAEIRKKRQEEWERVRKPDDPAERPEEPFDGRSLYEKLQEQKQKRDLDYEEAHKLKNMIKGLDDDEIEFLDFVDRTKLAADRKKNFEEQIELSDYRNRVATLPEKSIEEKLQISVAKPKHSTSKPSQMTLLKGAVVKKNERKKRKSSANVDDDKSKVAKMESDDEGRSEPKPVNVGLTCIGILPGLGHYSETSSDSEPESEQPKLDLLGRKIEKKIVEDVSNSKVSGC